MVCLRGELVQVGEEIIEELEVDAVEGVPDIVDDLAVEDEVEDAECNAVIDDQSWNALLLLQKVNRYITSAKTAHNTVRGTVELVLDL